ncbi:MAG: glycosyl hydrolase [Gemmatimonadetes bacterium]|nr:glycosyl hydrolase [Gemmatimonadota bacterium]|tara:strand:+ start:2961 stop:3986 length:1026 start_codon:yes stop_codon:yes gene_type:complete
MMDQDLWVSGVGDYHTYRIPALVRTVSGTVLAFCEGRRDGRSDTGQIDLLLRTSADEGETWSDEKVVVAESEMTCGNPCPVVDRASGRVVLTLCKNIGAIGETTITEGNGPRTVWVTYSDDEGARWSDPVEITDQAKDLAWTWYATGPGHGIQLPSGRLVIPCDHMVGVYFDRKADPYHSHVILSDDGGMSWCIGGIVEQGTNECAVALPEEGKLYVNCRNYRGWNARGVAWSDDQGETFTDFRKEDVLIEPICQASLVEVPGGMVFSNPASTTRERMTLRFSGDGGQTWMGALVLHPGPAAYSDLVSLPDGDVGCLFECGDEDRYERLRWTRRSVESIHG